MLKIEEFFDMEALDALRVRRFGEGLDEHDNFSWHIALKDDGILLGAGRMYREGNALRIGKVCLAEPDAPNAVNYREMIFRTLMLKVIVEKPEWAFADPEEGDAFYEKFGFRREGKVFRARPEELVFPKQCKECGKHAD